jgi:hypothetical protein
MGFKIEQGEKFALLAFSGLTIGIDDQTPNPADLGFSCWASGKLPFSFDAWWREQLGKIVSEQLENRCNFVLATKRRATSSETFGEESQALNRQVQFLFQGLAVSAGVPTFELGRLIYGTTVEPNHPNRPKIAVGQFERFHQTKGMSGPVADLAALRSAACFSHHLEELFEIFGRDSMSHHRLSSGIDALRTGFSARLAHTRLHQFVRAIEACLPAEQVWGASDFADYAATFLSRPEEQDTRLMLLQMYKLRNVAEHHRRFDRRALADVADPEIVAIRRTRQAEVFAREIYRRFLGTEVNHLPVFQSDDTLEEFWSDKDRVRNTWGSPLDLSSIS